MVGGFPLNSRNIAAKIRVFTANRMHCCSFSQSRRTVRLPRMSPRRGSA